jgi:hypothetical protein
MKLTINGDIQLDHPDREDGVTWLDVRAVGSAPAGSDAAECCYGVARIAIVHVGEIADAHGDVPSALRGTPLEAVAAAYFSHGWYKDDYADGAGIDLLYIESITMDAARPHKNLDLAIVRRLCDTLGSGCQLAVIPYEDARNAPHWGRLGFAITTQGRTRGLLHMKLGQRHAQVVETSGSGDFEVVPVARLHAPGPGLEN